MSLQYLNKSDLKNARLVSKQWSGCASEYLFAKLFVSPHSLNLEGFVTIARDPRLSKCVEELEYDAVHFSPDMTISQYFMILWYQTRIIPSAKEYALETSDPEIHCYLNIHNELEQNPNLSNNMMAKAWQACCGFAFIQWGYWKWMEEARFEKECTEQKTFLKALVSGLQNLTRLKTVKLRNDYISRAKLGGQGSRLARSWSLLHAYPGGIIGGPGLEVFNAVKDFRDLTFALSKARITGVRNLSIECILPPPAFRSYEENAPGFMCAGMSVYAGLENLKLSLSGMCAKSSVDFYFDYHKMSHMLGSMTTLKRLELELPDEHINVPVYFPYSVMFLKDSHWPHLTAFTVRNLAISTKDLVTLFLKKMPSVRHLAFGNIYLKDGTWEGIVEFLRMLHRLSSFSIDKQSFLLYNPANYHRRGYVMDNVRSVINYVLNRQDDRSLRHPALFSDEPAHCSLQYMIDVVRECKYKDNDGIVKALDKLIEDENTRYPPPPQ